MINKPLQKKQFEVNARLKEVQGASRQMIDFFKKLKLEESLLFDLRLCFEETLINAIKYGHAQCPHLAVKVELAFDDQELFIAIEDQGPGFDPGEIKDPTQESNIESAGGRGVFLVRHLMDRVDFVGRGNRVEMTKNFARAKRPASGQKQ